MSTSSSSVVKRRFAAWFIAAACVATLWNIYPRPTQELQAEVRSRGTTQRPHFKSGGERSELLLREMLVVLKRIDEKLGRIEEAVEKSEGDNLR